MIKKMSAAALIVAGALSSVAAAQAQDFAAAPMNPGPPRVTGMGPVGELANIALLPGNTIAGPVVQPILVPAGAAAPAPAPMVRHHRRHRHHM